MQCHEFENRLNGLLDERLAPESDAHLLAHAGQCEACGQLLAGHGALAAGLAGIKTPAIRADFAQCVVAEVVAERAVSGRAGRGLLAWWLVGGALATAAGLLLMVGIVQRNRDRQNKLAGDPPAVGEPTGVSEPQRGKTKPRSRGLAIANPGPVKPRGLGPRQPTVAAPFVPAGPPGLSGQFAAYGLSLENMAATLPEAMERLDEVERFSPGLRPIRVSFVMLLDALRRALPGLYHPAHEPQPTGAAYWDPWRMA